MINVLGIQLANRNAVSKKDTDYNLERARELILDQPGYDLYVLPELSTTGYGEQTFAHLSHLAENINNGPSFACFSSLAKRLKCHICYGFPRITGKGYTIAQAVVNTSGEIIALYDKIHIAQFGRSMEKAYFIRGNKICTFRLGSVSVGIIICYDIRFPELTRKMALSHGIDLLLHPVAFFRDNSYPSWHHFVITRALENQIYLLSINRAGKDFGQSIFCPPWIDFTVRPKVLGDGEQIVSCEINLDFIAQVRKEYNFRADRLNNY